MAERLPLVVFDGQCSFCRRWVERAKSITGQFVDYEPFQQAAPRFPQIDPAAFGRAVHLIEPDGRISRGAQAVFRTLKLGHRYPWLLRFYEFIPGFAAISEAAYRLVATHREATDRVDMLLIGPGEQQPSYLLTRQIFLRLLGLIYLMAFLSLWPQIDGLIGSRGILPINSFLNAIQAAIGKGEYWQFPTLCWFNPSDHFLHILCVGGAIASLLLIAGIAQLPALVILFTFYLSLAVAGQDFLEFQWDYLLVEAGFLAIFFAPARLFSWRLNREAEPSRLILLLLCWLLFRLTFMSGVVKLASGDPTWRNFTALRFHFMTQPLPPWTAWYFNQSPAWFQTLSCGIVFFAELAIPLLIFGPRRIRLIAFWGTIIFQLLIAGTGNYGFFNLLTIVLCCVLPDDTFWRWLLRRPPPPRTISAPPRWRGWITLPISAVLLSLTIPICIEAFGVSVPRPWPVTMLATYVEPFRIANGYGLFPVMTTTRPEIIIEGSDDNVTWKPYAFKWKPGDINRRPEFTTPHMPRLDWQMWFAALGDVNSNPWIFSFLHRLQEGSKPVLDLLQTNPFPDHPPKYIRAVLYDYQMTDFPTRRSTGAWWRRRPLGIYYQPPSEP
jgi:predicted DCC family thiol-disulfide oxidoreductase YuxK